jgi:bifunctional ADP-heptose synthase (sugar kinase/adenylyltransferase)
VDFAGFRAQGDAVNTRDKIVAADGIVERLKGFMTPGVKLVVAFGSFDLLSREMVRQLESARKDNVLLIAAVDPKSGSDTLLPAEARAQLAAGLAAVDLVVIGEARDLSDALPSAETLEVRSDLAPRLLARFRGPARA